MPLPSWRHQGPLKPSSCTTFTLNSHWGRASTGKKVLHLCVLGHSGSVLLFTTLPGVSVREGGSPARILEHIGQYWVPYPSRALYFLPAALAANPPEYLVLPEPLRPKQLHRLHTWPSQGQTASGANPSGQPISRGGNKTTSETQAQCD